MKVYFYLSWYERAAWYQGKQIPRNMPLENSA